MVIKSPPHITNHVYTHGLKGSGKELPYKLSLDKNFAKLSYYTSTEICASEPLITLWFSFWINYLMMQLFVAEANNENIIYKHVCKNQSAVKIRHCCTHAMSGYQWRYILVTYSSFEVHSMCKRKFVLSEFELGGLHYTWFLYLLKNPCLWYSMNFTVHCML